MTSFLDVIQPITDQLQAMSNLAGHGGNTYTEGTKKFQDHTHDVGHLSSPIHFLGQGSAAFISTVNNNANLSTKALTRLSDFQQACADALKDMISMSEPYDSESRYLVGVSTVDERKSIDPYDTYEYEYFLNADLHGYNVGDGGDVRIAIVRIIREDTLPGLSSQLDTLLNSTNAYNLLEGKIFGPAGAVPSIRSDFQTYQSQRHKYLYNVLQNALRNKEIDQNKYNYYIERVDSAYNAAIGIVDAIANNMLAGYSDWDKELIVAANNFLAQVGDIDTGQLDQFQTWMKIDSEFHDPRTRALLDAMLKSPYGAKVVQYLLNEADCKKYSPCGDSLIVWQDGFSDPTVGAYNKNGVIYLNAQIFNPNDSNNPKDMAVLGGELAHEAVETYYERAYHIPADTLPMDYLADYVYNVVSNQMAGQQVSPYPTYQQWLNGPQDPLTDKYPYQFSGYEYKLHKESNNPNGTPDEQWNEQWWYLTHGADPNFAGNPMGLDPSLLQNEPNWDISKAWDPSTNSFRSMPVPGI